MEPGYRGFANNRKGKSVSDEPYDAPNSRDRVTWFRSVRGVDVLVEWRHPPGEDQLDPDQNDLGIRKALREEKLGNWRPS